MSIVGDKECGEITNTLSINKRSVGALFSPSTLDGNPYSYKDQVGFGQGSKWPQSTFATDYGLLAIMSRVMASNNRIMQEASLSPYISIPFKEESPLLSFFIPSLNLVKIQVAFLA